MRFLLNLLAKLFGAASPEELDGLQLDTSRGYWILEGDTDLPTFLRALPTLVSGEAFLYLEDGSPDRELKQWIDDHSIPPPEKIARGTIWPRCEVFHIPLTPSNIDGLASISDRIAEPELAIHTNIYVRGRMLLEWQDAFDYPMLLDGRIPENTVTAFARRINFAVARNPGSSSEDSSETITSSL